ncbi:MAG: hypothetical protein HYS86_01025 [Candidatus Chisholmbacteria bacterium]|nr:hypothetical protein [Candidatus Chisholmbacteria bacterium]
MQKLATKIGVGIIGGAMATLLAVGPALAAPRLRCVIKDNGRSSHNKCELKVEKKVKVDVDNDADIDNDLRLTLYTGGNSADDNDGKVKIKTGKIDVTITITNRVNQTPPAI